MRQNTRFIVRLVNELTLSGKNPNVLQITMLLEKKRKGNLFGIYIRLKIDNPSLNCEVCRISFEKGDVANEYGRTGLDGNDEDEPFICRDCPIRASGPLDEISHLTLEAYNLIARSPTGDTPERVEFIFQLLGIDPTTTVAREIYERMCMIGDIQREIQERKRGRNDTKDLLAGTSMGEDDEEDDA